MSQVQRVVIELLTARNPPLIGIRPRMKAVFGCECVSTRCWATRARNEENSSATLNLWGKECSGRSRTASAEVNRIKAVKPIKRNSRKTQKQLSAKYHVSRERVQAIIAELCSRIFLRDRC